MANIKEACRDNPHVRDGQIDGYRVLEFVGGGGTACVYKVRTQDDPHPYALKLLQEKYFRNQFVLQQFEREGQRLLQLQHPNIVRFYGITIKQDYAYLVMDYVTGFELSDLLRTFRDQNRLMPTNEVMRTLVQVSRAINFLHGNDLIHRDIKAANVLLEDTTGKVYLVDFGIVTEESQAATTFNAGTRAYMPPEQQENIGVAVTKYSDIYAFGVMAYEMLAGRRPFWAEPNLKGPDAEANLIKKHHSASVPPMSDFRPDLPPTLNPIFYKVLAKRPEDRYASASDFVAELHQVLLPLLSPELHVIDEVAPRDPRKILQEQIARLDRVKEPARPAPPPAVNQTTRNMVIGVAVALLVVAGIAFILLGQGDLKNEIADTTATPSATSPLPLGRPDATEESLLATTEEVGSDATEVAEVTATTPTSLPPSPTATQTPTFTITPSPTVTLTPSATDIPEQAHYPLEGWRDSTLLGLEGQPLAAAFAQRWGEEAPLVTLNLGNTLQDFRAELNFATMDSMTRYGLAFRMQSQKDYLLFTVNPASATWQLEQVTEGEATLLQSGTLTGSPTPLLIQGYQEAFRIIVGSQLIQAVQKGHLQGGMGIWLEVPADSTPPDLTNLQVSLVGEGAITAALTATPTPAPLYNPFASLQRDVMALIASGDAIALSIHCGAFMPLFEGLERHLSNPDPVLVGLAQRTLQSSEIIYTLCEDSLNPEAIITVDVIRDYQDWENTLRTIQAEITAIAP